MTSLLLLIAFLSTTWLVSRGVDFVLAGTTSEDDADHPVEGS